MSRKRQKRRGRGAPTLVKEATRKGSFHQAKPSRANASAGRAKWRTRAGRYAITTYNIEDLPKDSALR